jgi:hypothetical protein
VSLDIIRLIDQLEDQADSYLRLAEVEAAVGQDLSALVADAVLLVDRRRRLDGSAVTLCRLNRHHPLVRELTSW